jgi:hypothetical protein
MGLFSQAFELHSSPNAAKRVHESPVAVESATIAAACTSPSGRRIPVALATKFTVRCARGKPRCAVPEPRGKRNLVVVYVSRSGIGSWRPADSALKFAECGDRNAPLRIGASSRGREKSSSEQMPRAKLRPGRAVEIGPKGAT